MKRCVMMLLVLCVAGLDGGVVQAQETLDDFLKSPQRVESVRLLMLALASQTDPDVAGRNAAELRKAFWAVQPEAALPTGARDEAMRQFDTDFQAVADLIRARGMNRISFLGIDSVLLKRSMDWYFGDATPRGPVLIRVSVQDNRDRPMTLHGIKVWTNWDEIKAITREIHYPAGGQVLTLTYEKDAETPAVTNTTAE